VTPSFLEEILTWCADHPSEAERRAIPERQFRDMLTRGAPLTAKQISWIQSVHEMIFETPKYENAWSAGTVPRGEALATPTPDVFKQPLPLKPPGRK
jgi:hypothetical protein